MIIIKLQGGLGNQMFQYAHGYFLAHKYNTSLKLDTFFFDIEFHRFNITPREFDLDIFNLAFNFATEKEINQLKKRLRNRQLDRLTNLFLGKKSTYLVEQNKKYQAVNLQSEKGIYLEGYWQSEKYFKDIAALIKKKFTIAPINNPVSKSLLEIILSTQAVCVNIRRGDFLTHSAHGVCSPQYYEKGIEILSQKYDNLHFFIFSDDMDWSMAYIKLPSNSTHVSADHNGHKFKDKFKLMISCKHFIIANSSFGWWAAYLGRYNDKTVIAPKNWMQSEAYYNPDIYCEGWIVI